MTPNPNAVGPAKAPAVPTGGGTTLGDLQQILQKILENLERAKEKTAPRLDDPNREEKYNPSKFWTGAKRSLSATGKTGQQAANLIGRVQSFSRGIGEMFGGKKSGKKTSPIQKAKKTRKSQSKSPKRQTVKAVTPTAPRIKSLPPGKVSWTPASKGPVPGLGARGQALLNPPIQLGGQTGRALLPYVGGGGSSSGGSASELDTQMLAELKGIRAAMEKLDQDDDPDGSEGFDEHESGHDPPERYRPNETNQSGGDHRAHESSRQHNGPRDEHGPMKKADSWVGKLLTKIPVIGKWF